MHADQEQFDIDLLDSLDMQTVRSGPGRCRQRMGDTPTDLLCLRTSREHMVSTTPVQGQTQPVRLGMLHSCSVQAMLVLSQEHMLDMRYCQ